MQSFEPDAIVKTYILCTSLFLLFFCSNIFFCLIECDLGSCYVFWKNLSGYLSICNLSLCRLVFVEFFQFILHYTLYIVSHWLHFLIFSFRSDFENRNWIWNDSFFASVMFGYGFLRFQISSDIPGRYYKGICIWGRLSQCETII